MQGGKGYHFQYWGDDPAVYVPSLFGPKTPAASSQGAVIADWARAIEEAGRVDPGGPLYGIPVVLKDQIDAQGMPTTLGSVLFRDFRPDRDAFAVARLRKAGAIVLATAAAKSSDSA